MTQNHTLVNLVKSLYETPSFKTKAALARAYLTGKDIPAQNRSFAIELYRECESEWPDEFKNCHEGLHVLAVEHLLREEYGEADKYFRAIPLKRLKATILLRMGMCHHAAGRITLAEPYLKEYISRKSEDEKIRAVIINLVVGYLRLKSDKKEFVRQMILLYKQQVPLSTDNVDCLTRIITNEDSWREQELEFAKDYYLRAKASPKRDSIALRIVEEFEKRRDLDTALDWAEVAGLKAKARRLEIMLHPPDKKSYFMSAFRNWLMRIVQRIDRRIKRIRRTP